MNREDLIVVGGSVDATDVTLGIHGYDLDPDAVTEVMGCPPTRAHRRGDTHSKGRGTYSRGGAWLYSVHGLEPEEPEAVLRRLLARFPATASFWAPICAQYRVVVGFGLHLSDWNRGFALSPEMLRMLATTGVGLDFDIYSNGD